MKYNLFLDDIRTPQSAYSYTNFNPFIKEKWIIVRNYSKFVDYINKNGLPDFIAFDHDLALEHYAPPNQYHRYDVWAIEQNFSEKTGYDCAKWLVDFCINTNQKLPKFFCHSMNPTGRENINALLNNFIKFQEKNQDE